MGGSGAALPCLQVFIKISHCSVLPGPTHGVRIKLSFKTKNFFLFQIFIISAPRLTITEVF